MEKEARYNHYVSKLLWYNRSKVDEMFKQRVARMAGMQLTQQLPQVASGGIKGALLVSEAAGGCTLPTSICVPYKLCYAWVLVLVSMMGVVAAADFFQATSEHYKFAVNAAIVNYQFHTAEGAIHLSAAGIQPVSQQPPVPQQGCVPLQLLPPGCVVTTQTPPAEGATTAVSRATTRSSWHSSQETDRLAAAEATEWERMGPGPISEQLPKQDFMFLQQQLQRVLIMAQPRLQAAFQLYQGLCRNADHLQLVDTHMGELQRPAQLGAFMALQRLHLENTLELLHCDWSIKVKPATD